MSSEGTQRRGAVFLHANQVEQTRMSDSPKGSVNVDTPYRQNFFGKSNVKRKISLKNAKTKNSSVSKINKRYSVENAGPSGKVSVAERRAKTTVPDDDIEGEDTLSTLPSHLSVTMANRRRTSISIRRGSNVAGAQELNRGRRMSPSGGGGRRKSVSPFGTPTAASGHRRRGSVQAPNKKKLEEPSLTSKQIEAFQEVFDLFDTNGGGSINADELHSALESVDIYISHKEIEDVLSQIDVDGNGEIDFQEFLTLMTNTEKFLEMFAAQNDEELPKQDSGREHLLFDALTQFMKKSALKQMDELVGYFHKKYKRMNAPHVVSHYAAGARLIGLTEKQLQEHLDRIRQSNRDNNYHSPYAEPLYLLHSVKAARRAVTKKEKPIATDLPKGRTGKIRLIINMHRSRESLQKEEEQENKKEAVESTHSKLNSSVINNPNALAGGGELHTPRLGWVSHRAKSIAGRLIFLGKKNTALTMEDLPKIRKNIQHATKAFNKEMSDAKAQETIKYWRKLKPNHINSKLLQTRFQKVFCAYSSAVRYGYSCQPKEIPYKMH
ncbi:uncharacterized protein [Antedon mediterranea]|uniref:uncharacterized protein n=1 Tax=Antedon mediterranea TaxID=105859 RepID=UPI003AF44E14